MKKWRKSNQIYERNDAAYPMKQKKLFDAFESNNSMVIDIPKKSNREVWKETANTIESVCKKLK